MFISISQCKHVITAGLFVYLQTDGGPVEQPEVLPAGWERCEGLYPEFYIIFPPDADLMACYE